MCESGQIALQTALRGQQLSVAQTLSDVKIRMTSPKQTAVTASFKRACGNCAHTEKMLSLRLCGILIAFLKRQLLVSVRSERERNIKLSDENFRLPSQSNQALEILPVEKHDDCLRSNSEFPLTLSAQYGRKKAHFKYT